VGRVSVHGLVAVLGASLGACATYRAVDTGESAERVSSPPSSPTASVPASAPVSTPVPGTAPLPYLKADADRDFKRAQELFDTGKEGESFLALSDYLRRHPRSERAADAQYMLAEWHYRRNEFPAALIEYRKVLKYTVKGAGHVPEATNRVGECLRKTGEFEKARIEWQAVLRRYPGTPYARRAEELLLELQVAQP